MDPAERCLVAAGASMGLGGAAGETVRPRHVKQQFKMSERCFVAAGASMGLGGAAGETAMYINKTSLSTAGSSTALGP